QFGGTRGISRGERVSDGFRPRVVLVEPVARAAMELAKTYRIVPLRGSPQDVAEEMVITKPLSPIVEAHEEEVRSLQTLQQPLRTGLSRDCVAQRAAQAVQDRGVQQETTHPFRLGRQHLLDEVVRDEPVAA